MILASIGLGAASLLLAFAFWRLPRTADRLVVMDALSACAIAACLLAAAHTGHTAFLDVAIGYAVIAFVGTISWAHSLGEPQELEP